MKSNLNPIGKILVILKIMWYTDEGNGWDSGYYKWNPLTWLWLLFLLIYGIPVYLFSDQSYGDLLKDLVRDLNKTPPK